MIMSTYSEFANVNGSLEQFASSAAQSAARAASRGEPQLLLLKPGGGAETSYDPVWLLREDAAQGREGKSGFTFWEPEVHPDEKGNGGKRTSLVVEVYDLAVRRGLQLRVPMETDRQNPYVRKVVKGEQPTSSVAVPAPSTPRYAVWDFDTFVPYAEHELVRGAKRAKVKGKYRSFDRGDRVIPAQEYAEIAEFAGFAYVDAARQIRHSGSRSGAFWFGHATSVVWKPGERAAKEQLLRSLRDRAKDDTATAALAGVWWTASGTLHSRFLDLARGDMLAGQWHIEPPKGARGLFAKALSTSDNTVIRIAQNIPFEGGW